MSLSHTDRKLKHMPLSHTDRKLKQTKISNYQVFYYNSEELHSLKREIFNHKIYHFEIKKNNPKIIDLGSHIGLSVLYFCSIYPQAQVWAVEPNPHNYSALKENVFFNNLSTVQTLNLAVVDASSDVDGEITLHQDLDHQWWSTTSIVEKSWSHNQNTTPFRCKAITLTQLLEKTKAVDFMKIDIESAERMILPEILTNSALINALVIEYHPQPSLSLEHLINSLKLKYHHLSLYIKNKEVPLKKLRKNYQGLALIKAQHHL